jgi:hypothetical protein
VTGLSPATAHKLAETCRSESHAAHLAANGECPQCGARTDMTEEEARAVLRSAGVIELPDSGGWLDTDTGSGYSYGTAWERHDDPEQT